MPGGTTNNRLKDSSFAANVILFRSHQSNSLRCTELLTLMHIVGAYSVPLLTVPHYVEDV
jgi:hypothetical protein